MSLQLAFLRQVRTFGSFRVFQEKEQRKQWDVLARICSFNGNCDKKDEARILLRSRLDLSRIEKQRRDSRDGFWEIIVARLQNDVREIVAIDFTGLIDADEHNMAIDSNIPVPEMRSRRWQKEGFFSIRASFTSLYHNWTLFGQNNPEGTDFANFVPRAPSSTSASSLGRLCLILFESMKCVTEDEDTEILNYTSKIVPYGAGYDDDDDDDIGRSLSCGLSRKRERILEKMARKREVRTSNNVHLVSAVKNLASNQLAPSLANTTSSMSDERMDEIFKLATQLRSLHELKDSTKLILQFIQLEEASLRCAYANRKRLFDEPL